MKKVFISQPMNGKTTEEIKSVRERAIKKAKLYLKDNLEVIDSYIESDVPKTNNQALWYLGTSIECLSKADVAYFAKGWQDCRGCKIEEECCQSYNIPRLYEDD